MSVTPKNAQLVYVEAAGNFAYVTHQLYTVPVNYPLSKATWSEDRMGVVGVLGELVVW